MFDRLYRLVIRHTALPKGILVIDGDSSTPSLGVDFSVNVNRSYVSMGGRLTVYGLTTEHIGLMSAIRRYEYAKNAESHNSATLAIGYRDLDTGYESPLTVVMDGTIIEATPGPLPTRSLTMSLFASALETVVPVGNEVIFSSPEHSTGAQANGIPMRRWLEGAVAAIPAGSDYQVILGEDIDSSSIVENAPYPTTLAEFKDMVRNKGLTMIENTVPVKSSASSADELTSDGCKALTMLKVCAGPVEINKSLVRLVSQETGMIGIPRSIQMGASVDVVLKELIQPGSFVDLQTTKFPKLSSDPKLYTNGGIYLVMSTALNGRFHGDTWMQTLTLNRGGSILKVKE